MSQQAMDGRVAPGAAAEPPELAGLAGGGGALAGFIYQRDVSIWLALELLLNTKTAQSVVLEPKSDEDVEAQIEADDEAARDVLSLEQAGGHQLIVQCKLRTGALWRARSISNLLAHGGARRRSALSRLTKTSNRYLLVTNSGVDREISALAIKALGHWPAAGQMPEAIARQCKGVEGRLAILASLDDEKLHARIDALLERFHVLKEQRGDCWARLVEAAEARMIKRVGDRAWTRGQVLEIVTAYGGFLGAHRVTENFVKPANWDDFRQAIRTRHGVIIRGPSGTGKTRTAEALCAAIVKANPDTQVVHVDGGPAKVHATRRDGPLLFMVEDPWGKYRVDPTADPWNDAIEDVLAQAGPDRRFIITSRSDILKARPPHGLSPHWFVDLQADHYRAAERARLYKNRWRALPRPFQSLVVRQGDLNIDDLETPAQIERLFRKLNAGPQAEEGAHAYVRRCLDDARDATIDKVVIRDVRASQSWNWAAIAWGLFQAHRRISLRFTPTIQQGLSDIDERYDDGLTPFLLYLVDAGMLRQAHDGDLSFNHPRVEQGLAEAMAERPAQSRRTLGHLLAVLFSEPCGDFGVEVAAHLIAGLKQQSDSVQPGLEAAWQTRLDAWLSQRVCARSESFQDDLHLAAKVGGPSSEVCELARWLTQLQRPTQRSFLTQHWVEPPYADEAWYARISAHPDTARICAAFVEQGLPMGRASYGDQFAMALQRLAPSLQSTFIGVASLMLGAGYSSNVRAVARGALVSLDAAEDLLGAAVDHIEAVNAQIDDDALLAAINKVGHDEAGQHLAEDHGEALYGAQAVVERFVQDLRRQQGWAAILAHPRAPALLESWIDCLPDTADPDEHMTLTKAAIGTSAETKIWNHNARHWLGDFAPLLLDRLAVGGEQQLRRALAQAFLRRMRGRAMAAAAQTFFATASTDRAIQLAVDMHHIVTGRRGVRYAAKAMVFLAGAPEGLRQLLVALLGTGPAPSAAEPGPTLALADDPWTNLRVAQVLASEGGKVEPYLRAVLADVDELTYERAELCSEALVVAVEAGLTALLVDGLGHRYAAARLAALMALAQDGDDLPESLLALAKDEGSDVRETMCQLLSERVSPRHAAVLMGLAHDTWVADTYHYEGEWTYPIGRHAVRALRNAPELPPALENDLWALASATDDSEVRVVALEVLARHFGSEGFSAVVTLALGHERPLLHAAAGEAIARQAVRAQASDILRIGDALPKLAKLWPAVWLAQALGLVGDPQTILACSRRLAADNQRGALLLPLTVALAERDRGLAEEVAALLPSSAADHLMGALRGVRMPRDGLLEVGTAHLTEILLGQMRALFIPEPTPAWEEGVDALDDEEWHDELEEEAWAVASAT